MNNLPPPYTPAEEVAAFTRLAAGCPCVRAEIIEHNMRLVVARATHIMYRSPLVGFDDLVQEGAIGLMHAVDKFDLSKGHKFSTYATYWIDQTIWRAIHSSGHIRLPIHIGERAAMVRKVADQIAAIGDVVSVEAVYSALTAQGLAIRRSTIAAVLNGHTPASLDRRLDDGDRSLLEEVAAPDSNFAEVIADADERRTMREDIEAMLAKLTPLQAYALRCHHGLDGEPMTYQQIADQRNVSRQAVEQAARKAYQALRFEYQ